MNYDKALDFINATYTFGEIIGLDNVKKLLDELGNPEESLKFIHVAGTNGKGSTSTMLSYVLTEAGYNTGLYISPYLEEFTERIQLNNKPIDKGVLTGIIERVKPVIEKVVAEGCQYPSQFEIVTAVAMIYYKEVKADIVVLEVGMGGRFDATNVIPSAEAAAIVSISFDHMQYLGSTLKEIAFEKAGIIKDNYDVSIYCGIDDEIYSVFEKAAKNHNARLYRNDKNDIHFVENRNNRQVLRYTKKDSVLGIDEFELALLGSNQRYNVLNVLNVLEILVKKGYKISSESILNALKNVVFTGRFEIMHKDPIIVIDGGHNIEGITSFVDNIKIYFPNKKINLFYGMLNDKQVDESIALLSTVASVIHTLTPWDKRAVPAEEMADFIRENYPDLPVEALGSISNAKAYIDFSKKDEVYAFTGSLYMIGEARTELRKLIAENS